jgi:hypothetical protein
MINPMRQQGIGCIAMRILRPEEVTKENFPQFREYTEAEKQEGLALAKAAFTIEDLLRFTEIVDDIPAEVVLAEIEQAQKEADGKSA